jgi:DnaD/phage-associated family protein
MAKVRLLLEDRKDIFLYSTEVENLFIGEFLPEAPGDYVKVYLFCLMYARFGQTVDPQKLCKKMGLTKEEAEEAWVYWESKGLVRRVVSVDEKGEEERTLVFLSQIESLYGHASEEPAEVSAPAAVNTDEDDPEDEDEFPLYISIDDMDFDDEVSSRLVDRKLRALYEKYQMTTGRTVSRQETSKIEDGIKVYGIEPEIFDFAIDYCADLEKYSIDYIFKVALRWTEEGCRTAEDAKKLLEKHSLRNSWYRQVFKALGWSRLPAPADREIMDRWFDVMNCPIGEVLDACNAAAGIREPNLRYVNKVLENRRAEKGGINTRAENAAAAAPAPSEEASPVSRKVLADYYEYIRTTDENEQKARVGEVLLKVPELKELFENESRVNSRMLSLKPGSDLDTRQRLRAERLEIEERKKQLLTENGFPAGYLNRKYRCEICRDTGYTDEGMVCSCCRQRAAEAYKWHTDKEKA